MELTTEIQIAVLMDWLVFEVRLHKSFNLTDIVNPLQFVKFMRETEWAFA